MFTRENGRWVLNTDKVWKTSTGKADSPTFDQSFRKYAVQKRDRSVLGLKWYTFVYGYGIHKFPGSGMNKVIGIRPVSHSCIRIPEAGARWIFDTVPVGSRVWIW